MEQIDIVIPTRDRIKKLKRTLNSIPNYGNVRIVIVCDGDKHTYNWLQYHRKNVDGRLVLENKGAVYCRNLVTQDARDGLLYATDDIVFQENSILNAFECFNKHFLDDDGVVGFVQEENNFHPTDVALVGQQFLRRYPDKKLFYPGYFHFACQEVYNLCQKLEGKFVQESQAKVFHYHPCNFPDEIDQTHQDARIRKKEDLALSRRREEEGLVWGFRPKEVR